MKVYIGPYPDSGEEEQEIDVKIDKYDTWSMDHTLAYIIVPMLQQLKKTKDGSPDVDMSDVPEELRVDDAERTPYDVDEKWHDRWDYVLDEMIWAFEQKCRDNWEEDYYGEWVENDREELGGHFINADEEGRKKHQDRMTNGFRLFGKYYENLWD